MVRISSEVIEVRQKILGPLQGVVGVSGQQLQLWDSEGDLQLFFFQRFQLLDLATSYACVEAGIIWVFVLFRRCLAPTDGWWGSRGQDQTLPALASGLLGQGQGLAKYDLESPSCQSQEGDIAGMPSRNFSDCFLIWQQST